MARDGEYSSNDGGKRFISIKTYEGLKISTYSHVEAIQFLGVSVCPERDVCAKCGRGLFRASKGERRTVRQPNSLAIWLAARPRVDTGYWQYCS